MTRYLCTSCEISFEHDSGKLRCPQCLRQHGLVEEGTQAPRKKPVPKRRILVLGLLGLSALGLAAGGGLLYYRSHTDLPGPGQLAILDAVMLKKTLLKRGVPPERVVDPFTAGEAVKALANSVEQRDPKKRAQLLAQKVASVIRGLKADFSSQGKGQVRLPGQLLAAAKAGKAVRVFSFELAALMLSVLRAAGLDAVLAQVHRVEAPMPTADPAGALGRYVVLVYRSKELGRQALLALDPLRALELPSWAGKGNDPEMSFPASSSMELLDDASAAARFLSLRALRLPRDASQEAYILSRLAIKASAPSATLHLARALVLATSGGRKDALAEAHKALSLRKDPPRYTTLAMLNLAQRKPEGALLNLNEAIKLDASFWPAHQLLAMIVAKPEAAQKHLEAALAVAPREPSVLLTKAARLISRRELDEAITVLRQVVAMRPDREARLMLFQALMATDRKEEAGKVKAQLLASATGSERDALLKLLLAMAPPPKKAPGTADPGGDSLSPPAAPRIPEIKLPDVKLGK